MGRRPSISTDEILITARKLFLSRGAEVPTAEIARSAGVSEGSIFRRFPTKQALFIAALGIDEEPPWIVELAQLDGPDLQVDITELCLKIIDYFRTMLPRMMLLWSSREMGSACEIIASPHSPPCRAMAGLTRFFDAQMRRGRMRVGHPELVARILLGSLHNYVFFETMGIASSGPIDARTFAENLVQTLFEGLKKR